MGAQLRKRSSYLEEGCVFTEKVSLNETLKLGRSLSGGRRRARRVGTLVPCVLVGQVATVSGWGDREAGRMLSKISWCFSMHGIYGHPSRRLKSDSH